MVEASTKTSVYLVHFRRVIPMMDFCLQELEAVVSICGLNLTKAELFVEDWATLKARDLV